MWLERSWGDLSTRPALDLAVLDAFEGDEYRRDTIMVCVEGQTGHADSYLPTVSIGATVSDWSLEAWTALHKPVVIGQKATMATTLRRRLSAQAG